MLRSRQLINNRDSNLILKNKFGFLSFLLISLFISALFTSCKPRNPQKIELGDTFYYWVSTPDSTPGDAMKHYKDFKKLEDKSSRNLEHVLGQEPKFVWIRSEFIIPPEFRNQPLGLVIPHLRFAEMLYLNGAFVSMFGSFPPNQQSTLFKSHFFNFPPNMLNQNGEKNTILIKVFSQGKSGISSHSFIQPSRFSFSEHELINFRHARMYMFFEGTLVFTFLLFLVFYISLKTFREYLDFALLNLATMFFIVPFFATEMPFYNDGLLPFIIFIKITFCIPICLMAYLNTSFIENFEHTKLPFPIKITRIAIMVFQVLLIAFAKDYVTLMNICPLVLGLVFVQLGFGLVVVIMNFVKKNNRRLTIEIVHGYMPLILSVFADLYIRAKDVTQTYPFITIFGWQISILAFIIILSVRFSRVYSRNEQLSTHLQEEVESRTQDLKYANNELSLLNDKLKQEKIRSDMDLEMASVVQKRFFPQPDKHFRGWDISIFYAPQAKVSGDLYDYYSFNDTLNGLSLFDVSGHGIAASLVTMLSKNVISHAFLKGYRNNESIDSILTKINNVIIYEKGEIDNYMTGLLCRFEDSKDTSHCQVEIGNAGHPYPLMYSKKDNKVYALSGNDGKRHFGAIGMKGIAVSFGTSFFEMDEGDILICYTDGLTEATNNKLDQFGTESIKKIMTENSESSAGELVEKITGALLNFTQGKALEDDITIIIAKRMNPKEFIPDMPADDNVLIEPEEVLEELDTVE